jgi:signal transduction histidine kinase
MGRTLESFLGLARGGDRERRPVGPEVLARVVQRVGAEAERRRVRIVTQVSPDAPHVLGEPHVLEQALANLVRNAVAASPEGAEVRVAWERDEHGGARVQVADRGSGFPAEGREALLALGAPGREGGHGLGLPLALRFVRSHGGRLSLLDAPGGGALVEVRLPAAPDGAAR